MMLRRNASQATPQTVSPVLFFAGDVVSSWGVVILSELRVCWEFDLLDVSVQVVAKEMNEWIFREPLT